MYSPLTHEVLSNVVSKGYYIKGAKYLFVGLWHQSELFPLGLTKGGTVSVYIIRTN